MAMTRKDFLRRIREKQQTLGQALRKARKEPTSFEAQNIETRLAKVNREIVDLVRRMPPKPAKKN